MTTETCTIITEFLGIPLDPCGAPGVVTLAGSCPNGHTRSQIVCDLHRKAFAASPHAVICEHGSDSGTDDVVMTITAANAVTQ